MKEWGKGQEQDYGEGPKKGLWGKAWGRSRERTRGRARGRARGMARDRTRERPRACGWGGRGGSVKISRLVQGQHPMDIL